MTRQRERVYRPTAKELAASMLKGRRSCYLTTRRQLAYLDDVHYRELGQARACPFRAGCVILDTGEQVAWREEPSGSGSLRVMGVLA